MVHFCIIFNFIPWYLGDGYSKAANLMKILSPLIIFIGLSNVFGLQFLIPLGKDKQFTLSTIIGAVINLMLNLILIPFLYSYGAAIGTIISELGVCIAMAFFARKKINFITIIRNSWKYIVAGLSMFIPCYITSLFLCSSIINTFLIIFLGAVIYSISLLILREEFVLSYIGKFLNYFKRKK